MSSKRAGTSAAPGAPGISKSPPGRDNFEYYKSPPLHLIAKAGFIIKLYLLVIEADRGIAAPAILPGAALLFQAIFQFENVLVDLDAGAWGTALLVPSIVYPALIMRLGFTVVWAFHTAFLQNGVKKERSALASLSFPYCSMIN